jgi:hypothetical protein
VLKFFLFPSSRYLQGKWWHQLARVVWWAWSILLVYTWIDLFVNDAGSPWRKVASGVPLGGDIVSEVMAIAILVLMTILVPYFTLLIPGLIYRIVLYVATGEAWKDQKAV